MNRINAVLPSHPFSLVARCLTGLVIVATQSLLGDPWSLGRESNPEGPGSQLVIRNGQNRVAAWNYGEGQFKPFLHVYGENGDRLTNSGLDISGKPSGTFGHHRGIFIGWNRIESDLGRRDLWHMKGTTMEVKRFTQLVTTGHHAVTEAQIHWRAGIKPDATDDLLLDEHRRITFSHTNTQETQIDFVTHLTAARTLTLGGDLQHAGVHFRAENEVASRRDETSYLWSPNVPVNQRGMKADQWQWATLFFPIGDQFYRCTEMTAPQNELEELSWRDYGRFGFFGKKDLAAGERLELRFRFIIKAIDQAAFASDRENFQDEVRSSTEAAYQQFLEDIEKEQNSKGDKFKR